MKEFFLELPSSINILLVVVALYIVIRSAHVLVDGAVAIARELNVSPLIIGATAVAVGTSAAELTINMVVVLGKGDTAAVVGNILGSNLINFGLGLGVPALIAGLIVVPRDVFERDIPLYLAATGLLTAFAFDGLVGRLEALILLILFGATLIIIIQSAKAKHKRSVLLVEVTEIEAISHPAARKLTRRQAVLALLGGLVVLVPASRLLICNTAALATTLHVPEFVIGLVIIGPGTSLPEITSAVQAVRRNHADLALGMAFGSNLFNLLFGLGLPALIHPLVVGDSALLSFAFVNVINLTLLAFLLLDFGWLGESRTINPVIGAYLVITYVGFISYEVVIAAEGTSGDWLVVGALMALAAALWLAGRKWIVALVTARGAASGQTLGAARILCATRGGSASQPTHEAAIRLAKEQGAELLFLYVFDHEALQSVVTPILINVEAQVKHMLAFLQTTAQEQARQAGVRTRVIAQTGNLREQIKHVATKEQVTMIVIGSPAGESSVFQREALRELAVEIEGTTGIEVLNLSGQQVALDTTTQATA